MESCKINNVDVVIKEVPVVHKSENEVYMGMFWSDKAEIKIKGDLPKQIKYKTLIHELTHAFAAYNAMESKEDFNQEDLCEFMSCFGKSIIDIADAYFAVNENDDKNCEYSKEL